MPGLQGMYFIRDEAEDALKLPQGKYEIPLLVYDRFLLPDGQLEYPVSAKAGGALGSGGFRQCHPGQRQALSLPGGRAAQVSLPA